jgi:NADPH:quinone reductase
MRVIRIKEYGGPDVMRLEEVPTPEPGPGQLRVRVEAAGVNFIDTYQRRGQYRVPLPYAMGLEGAGVVEATGAGVRGITSGDPVAWAQAPGSYASHVLVEADRAVPVPEGIDARQAAAAMLQGLTAHYLCHSTYVLKAGEVCLVHAAAGGVGLLLTQIAKRCGARVIATVGTEDKARLAREAGADDIVLYRHEDFAESTRRLTGGAGVQVVYDSVGKDTFDRSLKSLSARGMLVLYGQASGSVPPFDPQVLNNLGSLFLTRPSLGHYTRTRDELRARADDVFAWIADGSLKLRIGAAFPLEQASEAHRQLEGRLTTGKVLLQP